MSTTNILIAIPAYGGHVTTGCARTIGRLFAYFASQNIPVEMVIIEKTGVDIARNMAASEFLEAKQHTHILFLDNDMDVQPDLIECMLKADKPVIAAVSTYRSLDLEKFYQEAKTRSFKAAVARASKFNVKFLSGEPFVVTDSLARADWIGTAVMLIQRTVFEQLLAAGNIAKRRLRSYRADAPDIPYYGFFDQIRTAQEDNSEDISFCMRWRKLCNGEIWVVANAEPIHQGMFNYQANLCDGYLKT